MQYLEYLGTICSFLYVILLMKNTVWAWPFGIVGSGIMAYTFLIPEYPLYMEAGSYTLYVLIGIYGWFNWSKGKPQNQKELPITEWKLKYHVLAITITTIMAIIAGLLLSNTKESNPYFDSFTTLFAILGTWMQARKLLSNWIYWFVINIASIVLYISNGFDAYAILAFIFTLLSVSGFLKWRRIYTAQNV